MFEDKHAFNDEGIGLGKIKDYGGSPYPKVWRWERGKMSMRGKKGREL